MRQKINLRLSLIALFAILTTTIGITIVYYSLFQKQVRDDLKQNAYLLMETGVFQDPDVGGSVMPLQAGQEDKAQTGTAQTESAQPETRQIASVQTGTTHTESAQPETRQMASAQPGTTHTESAQPETKQMASEQPATEQSDPAQPAQERIRITWINTDGTVLFDNDTDATGLSNHFDRPEIRQALENGEGESVRHSDTMHMNTFYYALLMENGTILRVSTRARTITNVILTALPVIAGIAVMVLFFCIWIGHFLTRQLMRPLEEMAENLDDIKSPAYKELEPFADKIRLQHEDILAAAKIRQDFTANVSHELKTPITAISGYAELIENRLIDEDSEIHIAKQIRHNADRLHSLVNDIIRLSELDQVERQQVFETVDLPAVAKECVDDLTPMAAQKQITLSIEGDLPAKPIEVYGDPTLLREMIENLVQNAIRYNKEKGSVQTEVRMRNGHPEICVRDTGIGIPADQIDRIFERFFRVDKSRSRETGGTGLGLAIVKHIVELHGAEITVNSRLGEGTEVNVRF